MMTLLTLAVKADSFLDLPYSNLVQTAPASFDSAAQPHWRGDTRTAGDILDLSPMQTA